jgi:hypothetical protein
MKNLPKKLQALNRIIAREVRELDQEEKLRRGLKRGLYTCEVCGRKRGWHISKGPFKYINADEMTAFRCCDCKDCFEEHSGIWGICIEV